MHHLVGLSQTDLGNTSYPILVPKLMSSAGKTTALRAATHPASLKILFSKTQSCFHKSNHLIHVIVVLSWLPSDVSASLDCLSPQSGFLFCHIFKPIHHRGTSSIVDAEWLDVIHLFLSLT